MLGVGQAPPPTTPGQRWQPGRALPAHLRAPRTWRAPSGHTARTASSCSRSRCLRSSACRWDRSFLQKREEMGKSGAGATTCPLAAMRAASAMPHLGSLPPSKCWLRIWPLLALQRQHLTKNLANLPPEQMGKAQVFKVISGDSRFQEAGKGPLPRWGPGRLPLP